MTTAVPVVKSSVKDLIKMVKENNIKGVEFTLDHGADPNGRDDSGDVPLPTAVNMGHDEIVTLLLERKNLDVNAMNGFSALMAAAANGRDDLVLLLLTHGANVNLKGKNLRTALMDAVENDEEEIANVLISHGALLNEQNNFGQTALMLGAKCRAVDSIRLLLERGADVLIRDVDGKNALDLAKESGNGTAIALLQKATDAALATAEAARVSAILNAPRATELPDGLRVLKRKIAGAAPC
jgi:ankyrin repeat protein